MADLHYDLLDGYREARADELGYSLTVGAFEPEFEELLAAASAHGSLVLGRWKEIVRFLRTREGTIEFAGAMAIKLANSRTAVRSSTDWLREQLREVIALVDESHAAEHALSINVPGQVSFSSLVSPRTEKK